jgi:four helix bundle protein
MQNKLGSTIVEHAILVASLSRPLVEAVQRKDKDLASWFFNHSSASQLRRAISSIALNAAEAHGNARGNTRVRFESALGSLYEARAGIELAIAWGYLSQAAARETLQAMHALGGWLYGLARR